MFGSNHTNPNDPKNWSANKVSQKLENVFITSPTHEQLVKFKLGTLFSRSIYFPEIIYELTHMTLWLLWGKNWKKDTFYQRGGWYLLIILLFIGFIIPTYLMKWPQKIKWSRCRQLPPIVEVSDVTQIKLDCINHKFYQSVANFIHVELSVQLIPDLARAYPHYQHHI